MPSSMIFVGLVVLWLLILVPAVARHRQEVVRPSVAALSGRVLARSTRRQNQEVGGMSERDGSDAAVDRAPEPVVRAERRPDVEVGRPRDESSADHDRRPDRADDRYAEDPDDRYADDADVAEDAGDAEDADDRRWERPPAHYRAGRGGFDAEAAALAAQARYAFRQRVVLVMLLGALATGIIAAVAVPGLWWPHAAIDVVLVGYLVYLRRQVRLEETIRARRAARLAGTRRAAAADDPELDDWAERGREAVRPRAEDQPPRRPADPHGDAAGALDDGAEDDADDGSDLDESDSLAVDPVTSGAGPGPSAPPTDEEEPPALPRLRPTPLPPLPAGTAVVEDEDAELDLDGGPARAYRRAAGQ